MLLYKMPWIGRLYRQRDRARAEVKQLRDSFAQTFVIDGIFIEIPIMFAESNIDVQILHYYEKGFFRPFNEKLLPSDVVVDISGSIGLIASWIAKRLDSGRVIMWESDPDLRSIALNNFRKNGISVEINQSFSMSDLRSVEPNVLIINQESCEIDNFSGMLNPLNIRNVFVKLNPADRSFQSYALFKRIEGLGFKFENEYSNNLIATFSRFEQLQNYDFMIPGALTAQKNKGSFEENFSKANFERRMYSQFGEDMLIEHLFPTAKTGIYIDLGCFHPWRFSNTARLYERGWRGINVDASNYSVNLFNEVRPDDINLNFAIGGDSGSFLELFSFSGADPCNTCDRGNAERIALERGITVPVPVNVPVISLRDLCDRYIQDREISVLNIDLETKDLACLGTGNWSKFRPALILVEDDEFLFSAPADSQIFCFMRNVGYKMFARCHATSMFVREEDFGRCRHGGVLERR